MGRAIDLSRIPLDDRDVYAEIQRADTVGDFQIESRAQMQSLLRTLPENLDDLTIQVALVRPGPIQGGAVHPYIERRQKLRENPSYVPPVDHPSLAEPLRDTLGVVVFQDQVLEVATALAGFTVGEAEGLRRAMSRKRSEEAIEALRSRFVAGALAQGVDGELANLIYDKLAGFSGFGFPKSHSAAFALLAYQSAWLRHHYPAEFLCALLNAQPMGFYPPASLVRDGQRRGVEVLLAGRSLQRCALPPRGRRGSNWPGVHPVGRRGGGRDGRRRAAVRRRRRPCPPRAGESRRARRAGRVGRLRPLRSTTRAALASRCRPPARERSSRDDTARAPARADGAGPRAARADRLGADARRLRDDEPLGRTAPARAPACAPAAGTVANAELPGHPAGEVAVAGMAIARQRPATANGVVFMLLEDETGQVNLIVPPPVYEQHRPLVRGEPLLLARGRLERAGRNINILVRELETLGPLAREVAGLAEVQSALPRAHHFGHR